MTFSGFSHWPVCDDVKDREYKIDHPGVSLAVSFCKQTNSVCFLKVKLMSTAVW